MFINGIEIRKGFNINDKQQEFTKQIFAGTKIEETRASHTLDSLIGQTGGTDYREHMYIRRAEWV